MTIFIEERFGESPEVFVASSSFTLSASPPLPAFLFLAQFAVPLYQAMEGVRQDADLFGFSTIPSQGSQLFLSLPLLLFYRLQGPLMLTSHLGGVLMVVIGLLMCWNVVVALLGKVVIDPLA